MFVGVEHAVAISFFLNFCRRSRHLNVDVFRLDTRGPLGDKLGSLNCIVLGVEDFVAENPPSLKHTNRATYFLMSEGEESEQGLIVDHTPLVDSVDALENGEILECLLLGMLCVWFNLAFCSSMTWSYAIELE